MNKQENYEAPLSLKKKQNKTQKTNHMHQTTESDKKTTGSGASRYIVIVISDIT